MKRVLMIAALTAAVSLFLVAGAFAGTQDGAKFTLHASTYKNKLQCTTNAPTIPCSQYNLTWAVGVDTNVYLVVANGDAVAGIAGASCGILYDNAFGSGRGRVRLDALRRPGVHQRRRHLPARPASLRVADLRRRQPDHLGVDHQLPAHRDRAPDGVHAIAGVFLPVRPTARTPSSSPRTTEPADS